MILIPNFRLGNAVAKKSIKDLVSVSDIVTIHVPDTDQTRMMINKNVIKQFKKGAILLNYARGEVVDLDALAIALEEGHLAGAGVDVYPLEPEKNGDQFTTPCSIFPMYCLHLISADLLKRPRKILAMM